MVDVEAQSRQTILLTLEKGIEEGQEKTVRESLKTLHQLDLKDGSCSLKSNSGYDLLRLSLEKKHVNITKLLLQHGVEINRTIARKTCNTPLHLAIKNNDLNTVKLLLENGANTKRPNSKGKTPLYLAVELDHQDIAEILLKKDVSVNVDGRSSMSVVLAAASNGNEYLFKLLLSKGGELNLQQFDKGSASMLQVAVEHTYLNTVEKIINSNRNSKIIKDPGNEKLLTVAVMNSGKIDGSRKIVEILLKAKFPVDLKNAKSSKFICRALEENHHLIVNKLLKVGFDLDDYWDVLSTACRHNHIETVEAVIDKVKDVDYEDRSRDNSPLLFNVIDNIHFIIKEAAKNGGDVLQHDINLFNRWVEIMKILVKKGVYVNFLVKKRTSIFEYNSRNLTSLHYIANHTPSHALLSLKPIANLLISAGAWTSKMESCIEPLDYAISKENPDVVEVLLQHTWDVNDSIDKTFSLHYAAKNESPVIIEMLLKRGANVNAIDTSGNTPLHRASVSGRVKVMECLLEHNAQVNVKNFAGETPLHLAVISKTKMQYNEHIEVQCIETLMKYKADIDATDDDLMTPLHCAAKNSFDSSVIKKLLEYKANIHSINKFGLTPLLVAATFNRVCIVEFLIESGANASDSNISGETVLHLVALRHHYPIDNILKDNFNINILSHKNKTMLDYLLQVMQNDGFYFSSYRENTEILIKYMLKLHNIGVFICNENLQGIDKYLKPLDKLKKKKKTDIVVFKEKCEKEAMLMKESKIGDSNMTFYKLFKKSTHQLAQYLLNKGVIKEVKPNQYNNKFPIYRDLITRNLKRGFERKQILDQDTGGLIKTMFYNLPGSCIDEILSYLDNEELQTIITANKIKIKTNTSKIYTSVVTRSRATKKFKLHK